MPTATATDVHIDPQDPVWLVTGAVALAYSILVVAFANPIIAEALVRPEFGLDASGQLAFSEAVERGLLFGRDIVFTNGPLGFLTGAVKTPGLVPAFVAWSVLGCVATVGLGVGIARRSRAPWWVFLPAFCAVVSLTPSFEARFYGLAVMLVAHHALARSRGSLPLQIIAGAMLGCATLAKLTFLAVGLGVGAALAIADGIDRRWRGAALLAVIATGPVLCWVATSGSPSTYLDYLVTGSEVSRCFSGALQAHGPPAELVAYLASAGALLAMFVTTAPGVVPSRLARGAALGAVLFVAFKHGFVRHDAHALVAWSTILYSAVFLAPAGMAATRGRPRAAVTCVLCATLAAFVWSQHLHGRATAGLVLRDLRELPEDAKRAVRLVRGTWVADLTGEWDAVLARVAADNPLPPSPAPFDLYPWDLRILFAHRVPWRPRPVFQSYQACSAALLERNAAWLRESGASTILLTIATIDGRLPSLDDGLSWLVLLERYRLVDRAGAYLVLQRREDAERASLASVSRRDITFDERVDLPDDPRILWASIEIRPTLLGHLVNLLYKLPPLQIALTLENGSERRYRIVPEMAAAGFLLSPLVLQTEDLAALLLRDPEALRTASRLRTFRISGQAPARTWLFEDRIEITLESLAL